MRESGGRQGLHVPTDAGHDCACQELSGVNILDLVLTVAVDGLYRWLIQRDLLGLLCGDSDAITWFHTMSGLGIYHLPSGLWRDFSLLWSEGTNIGPLHHEVARGELAKLDYRWLDVVDQNLGSLLHPIDRGRCDPHRQLAKGFCRLDLDDLVIC